jgi:hypothetical protein
MLTMGVCIFFFTRPGEKNIHRTFAHNRLACGSVVLYLSCVSFFAPTGRKATHKD